MARRPKLHKLPTKAIQPRVCHRSNVLRKNKSMAATTTDRLAKYLAGYSRKSHLIALCLVAVPTVIGTAWAVFPIFEGQNLGYRIWHFSCLLGFMIAGFGIACWIAERLSGIRSPSWITLLILACFGVASMALRFFGDFYWAFNRGYFLD